MKNESCGGVYFIIIASHWDINENFEQKHHPSYHRGNLERLRCRKTRGKGRNA